jgi:hypothetical protein
MTMFFPTLEDTMSLAKSALPDAPVVTDDGRHAARRSPGASRRAVAGLLRRA